MLPGAASIAAVLRTSARLRSPSRGGRWPFRSPSAGGFRIHDADVWREAMACGVAVRQTDLGLEVVRADGSGRLLVDVGTGPGQWLPTEEQERQLPGSFGGAFGTALSRTVAWFRRRVLDIRPRTGRVAPRSRATRSRTRRSTPNRAPPGSGSSGDPSRRSRSRAPPLPPPRYKGGREAPEVGIPPPAP